MLEPLPDPERLRRFLTDYEIADEPDSRAAVEFYATYHALRFRRSLELMPALSPRARVLELGAAPYLMTVLLERHLGFAVTTANFFGDYGERPAREAGSQTLVHHERGETHRFDFRIFNVERDRYPYEDGSFELVVCCEILEHLAADPSHMLRECNRVLTTGGRLFLSTPNVASLGNVLRLVRGRSIYQAYAADGVYGRHNREYTAVELRRLLEVHGFDAVVHVEDAYPHRRAARALTAWGPLRRFRDNLFAIATKRGEALPRYPEWLYVGYDRKHSAAAGSIVMEDGRSANLGEGWHDYEHWPPGIRWTTERATARLRLGSRPDAELGLILHAGPVGARGRLRVAGNDVGTFSLDAGERAEVRFPIGSPLAGRDPGTAVEVEILADTFVPCESAPGSPDRRRLGVAVEALWIR